MTQMIELTSDLKEILTLAFSRKASSIKALDVRKLTSYTDTIVIITAGSARQVTAIAEHMNTSLKALGKKAIGTEGLTDGHWALLDYGHVIIHVFDIPTGQLYDLKGLWSDAPEYDLSELDALYPQ